MRGAKKGSCSCRSRRVDPAGGRNGRKEGKRGRLFFFGWSHCEHEDPQQLGNFGNFGHHLEYGCPYFWSLIRLWANLAVSFVFFFSWSRVLKRFGQDLIMVVFSCLILLFGSSFDLANIAILVMFLLLSNKAKCWCFCG